MWVKDYMFTDVWTITKEKTLKEAVKLMVENKTNSLIVVDEDYKPVGTLSSHSLIKEVVPAYLKDDPMFSQFGREGTFDKYAEKFQDKKIEEIMHGDIHKLAEDDAMIEAASYAVKSDRRLWPVIDKDGKLIGATTRTCIKNALYNALYKDEKINPKNGGCCSCGKEEKK